MIPRYSRPEMAQLWTDEAKFTLWMEIEVAACEAQAALGLIPPEALAVIQQKAGFDADRIAVLEAELKHDVLAFLTSMAEHVGPESRFVHLGMTSSDVVDTAFAATLAKAGTLLDAGLDRLMTALLRRAEEHRHTPCIGRTHGIHGEPTTFGMKLLGHYAAFRRQRQRLAAARNDVARCTISGAVGTYSSIDPSVEAAVAARLGLTPETLATQVIPRDRHAHFFAVLAQIASSVECLAVEIRHLQRSEVREAEEYFSPGQKGSSAIPHKRNPVLTENLTGLARVVRSMVVPALENVALWHERDISHSSVERMIGPDATVTLDFALNRLAGVVENLLVYPDQMARNLSLLRGLHYSQTVMLALAQAGMSREDAYRLVQGHAMEVWARRHDDPDLTLKGLLAADPVVAEHLTGEAFESLFRPERFLTHVDMLFDRVLAEG